MAVSFLRRVVVAMPLVAIALHAPDAAAQKPTAPRTLENLLDREQ